MHELSLCGAMAEIVSRRAGQRQVDVVHVQVGQLRQVVPTTLDFCWSMVCSGTDLAGSVLDIERIPAVLRCRECRSDTELGDAIALACRSCGGLNVDVVSGEEFVVTELELAGV